MGGVWGAIVLAGVIFAPKLEDASAPRLLRFNEIRVNQAGTQLLARGETSDYRFDLPPNSFNALFGTDSTPACLCARRGKTGFTTFEINVEAGTATATMVAYFADRVQEQLERRIREGIPAEEQGRAAPSAELDAYTDADDYQLAALGLEAMPNPADPTGLPANRYWQARLRGLQLPLGSTPVFRGAKLEATTVSAIFHDPDRERTNGMLRAVFAPFVAIRQALLDFLGVILTFTILGIHRYL